MKQIKRLCLIFLLICVMIPVYSDAKEINVSTSDALVSNNTENINSSDEQITNHVSAPRNSWDIVYIIFVVFVVSACLIVYVYFCLKIIFAYLKIFSNRKKLEEKNKYIAKKVA